MDTFINAHVWKEYFVDACAYTKVDFRKCTLLMDVWMCSLSFFQLSKLYIPRYFVTLLQLTRYLDQVMDLVLTRREAC
jgi:hypothetical protein